MPDRTNSDIIRVAREMEKISGVPSSQFRRALREERQQENRARTTIQPPRPQSETNPSAFAPSNDTNSFAPKPFAPPPVQDAAGQFVGQVTKSYDVLEEGVLVSQPFLVQ